MTSLTVGQPPRLPQQVLIGLSACLALTACQFGGLVPTSEPVFEVNPQTGEKATENSATVKVNDTRSNPPTISIATTDPVKVIHDGGIVFVTKKGLLKDRGDGYQLISNNSNAYRTMALFSNLLVLSEAPLPDGTWTYGLLEDPTHYRSIVSRTRNRATATGSLDVPDADIMRHHRISAEATRSTPADAPPGTLARRMELEIIADPAPIRGTVTIDRVYFPEVPGGREREWRTIQTSKDLRFDLPAVPALSGQPFVIRKILTGYLPQVQGDDLALVEDEQQLWPDGMVLQQVTSKEATLKAFTQRGTIILPDAARTPVNFERRFDIAADTATQIIRTLAGIAIEFRYGPGHVFRNGEIRTAGGTELATLKAASANAVLLTYSNGATESVNIE
ncbi:MAG: hypothetical protein HY692_01660 [Cyanobacteria bacterium NC_groundwater_1444_Ag_S-0.65um_54_12]|nr:hypothetical protein [Cyanobacteria bacterium NC_groundwater_1444_Ag_S-0.65um_54_12]